MPLQAVLVGVRDPEAGEVRAVLSARGVPVEAEVPTAAAAAERFAGRHPPCVLIADARAADGAGPVRDLRAAFPSWPLVALAEVTGPSAAATLLAVNRAGADQVVGVPVSRADLDAALDQLARRVRPADRPPTLVAVSGAVPGCGCSTVAASLAAELAQGYRLPTILAETAVQMGVQAFNLNARVKVSLADLLSEPETLDADQVRKALIPATPGLLLLAAPQDLARPAANPTKGVLKVLGLCKQLAPVVVADLPCLYDDLHFETLWAADQVVLVADQSLPAVRTARMVIDAMSRANAVKAVHVVLNRYEPAFEGLTASKIAAALGVAGVLTVPNDYAGVMRAASEGRPVRVECPDSPVVAAVRAVAAAVAGRPAGPDEPHLFARLLGTLKRLGGGV